VDAEGRADFDALYGRVREGEAIAYAFDLLQLDGEDMRPRPLEERKALLLRTLRKAGDALRYNDHLNGDGETIFDHACRLGLEGIVAKLRNSKYRSGRSDNWIKIKNKDAPAYTRAIDGTF
jgi:bifunctional non-homologous end joining protein LigD